MNCDNFDDNSNADNPFADDDSFDVAVVGVVERMHMDPLADFEDNNSLRHCTTLDPCWDDGELVLVVDY